MSKPIYLYRAVSTVPENMGTDEYPLMLPAGSPLGRVSGYLSRSSAVEAGERHGVPYEIQRSEPIVFLSRAEKLRKQIAELEAELQGVA